MKKRNTYQKTVDRLDLKIKRRNHLYYLSTVLGSYTPKIFGLITIIFIVFPLYSTAQDCIVYDREHFQVTSQAGSAYNMNIGQTITSNPIQGYPGPSFKVLNPNAAVLIKINNSIGNYDSLFVYSEESEWPKIGGTSLYQVNSLTARCIQRLPQGPQPEVFVPINRANVNSGATPHSILLTNAQNGHRVLMMRKAYFYENSEDIGTIHGPYGDLKVNVCAQSVNNLSYSALEDPSNWHNSSVWYDQNTLYGPIYDEPTNNPAPKNEWIDGPWGAEYSNVMVWDWDAPGNPNTVTILVSESDGTNAEDYLGKKLISKTDNTVFMSVGCYGWILFENVDITSGAEPSIEVGSHYWFDAWDGSYPESVYGPNGSAYGSQYKPFFNYSDLIQNAPPGSDVGLMGGKFP
ncbi:MAG: hypothetical protein KDD63_26345, partial [Bacteroidetes bacterium]|nr:hypothetical protein [Bacteroidota bacterium]